MEPLPAEEVRHDGPRQGVRCSPLLLCSSAPLLFFLAGCVTLDAFRPGPEGPPAGAPCHAVATWKNEVFFTPDPTRGGNPGPGLVGRLYLFSKEVGYPVAANGAVTVDLYDCTPTTAGQQPVLIEQWRIDKDTLQRLQHKDGIGWGYTLFLPWGTYRPDLRNLQLRLRYEPVNAAPLYAAISQVMLQEENRPAPVVTSSTTPVTTAGTAAGPAESPRSQSFNLARQPADAQVPR